MTIARTAAQNDWPKNETAITPTNTVANSRFGDVQVPNRVRATPCRSDSGMNSAPPGSTAATTSP